MKRENWTVGAEGIRPSGDSEKCFYCKSPVGGEHKPGCVIRSRTVVVRTIVEHVIDVPEDWHKDLIEFTEGSMCSRAYIDDLTELNERISKSDHCPCEMVTREYVREADEEDEKESVLFVKELKS